MLAVKLMRLEAAKILVDHGANPKAKYNQYEVTPLQQAVGLKHVELVKIILSAL